MTAARAIALAVILASGLPALHAFADASRVEPAVAESDRPAAANAPASPSSPRSGGLARPAATTPAGAGAPELAPSSSTGLLVTALIAIGAVAWWRRRKQGSMAPAESLETLAQTSLGGRARALWLRAGDRHMIVAVTARTVRTLDHWPEPPADGHARRDSGADSGSGTGLGSEGGAGGGSGVSPGAASEMGIGNSGAAHRASARSRAASNRCRAAGRRARRQEGAS